MRGKMTWAALVAVGLVVACGNSEGNKPAASGGSAGQTASSGAGGAGTSGSATTGGLGGAGGSAAGSSSSAGTGGKPLLLGDTPTEACIAYAMAVCNRIDECGNTTPTRDCLSVTFGCPDLVNSPGATRTVEGLKACAEAYKTLPCDQVKAGTLPPCVTPGTRQRGESCVYPSQCSSLSCEGSPGCGKCAIDVGMGEDCSADDVACGPHLYCDGSPQTCQPAGPKVEVAEGAACGPFKVCMAGFYCAEQGGSAKCAALPKLNEPCPMGRCAEQLYCAEGTCAQRLGLGASCDPSPFFACDTGLRCYVGSEPGLGTCKPAPGVGEPCWAPIGSPTSYECADTLHCDETTIPPQCAGIGKTGEGCGFDSDCEKGLFCECPTSMPDCKNRICLTLSLAGEPCNDTTAACHPGFSCEAGQCKPRESRGAFEQECSEP